MRVLAHTPRRDVADMADGPIFLYMNIARLCVSSIGFALIYSFKIAHGIAGARDQAKAGLPTRSGIHTLGRILVFAWKSPSRGAWVVGHLLCMFSSFVGRYVRVRARPAPGRL